MNTTALVTVLRAAGRAGVSVCLWGDPGTGKSSLIQAAALADGVPCETVIGSLREPSDFAGLPVVGDDGVHLEPPAWAKRLQAAQGGYLFLDELSTSPPAVQAAMLGVALERKVGDLLLPRSVQVVAVANPPERAADGWDLTPPRANRFLHVAYTPPLDGWLDGMTAGFALPASGHVSQPSRERTAIARASVAAFIRSRPALLDAYPTNPAASGRAWPSRRTWTMTADVLALLDRDDTEVAYLATAGLVGEGAAVEYLTWRREADLPDPSEVVADPVRVAWRSLDSWRVWAILAGVVGYSTGKGTVEAWRAGWVPLAAAAEMGKGDVAAACARTLLLRPTTQRSPAVRGTRVCRRPDRCRPDECRVNVVVRDLTAEEARLLTAARLAAVEHAPYLAHALFQARPVAAEGLGTFAVDRTWRCTSIR
jgi:AAA domain (dynein-related subfamily)